jgi:NADPH-dependent 2,4-dienoyl-CoA reductase/sulfur reductase-like enzyme
MEQPVMIGSGTSVVACLNGDEAHANYNRTLLSCVSAGEREADEITKNGVGRYRKNSTGLRLGIRIVEVNTKLRTLTGEDGSVTRYDKLIFASGSSASIPPGDGIYRRNVFTLRWMDHAKGRLRVAAPGKRTGDAVLHLADTLMNTAGEFLRRNREIATINFADRVVAIDAACPERGGPLCDGAVTGTGAPSQYRQQLSASPARPKRPDRMPQRDKLTQALASPTIKG